MTIHRLIRQAESLVSPDDLDTKLPQAEFPLLYANQIDDIDNINCVIDDWLPIESTALLYSPKDHFKSFIAVDWFMSIACGIGWNGFDVLNGACVYIAGEGNQGLKRRIKAWCIYHDIDLTQQPIALSTIPMQVLDKNNIQHWVEYLTRVLIDLAKPIRLVVIDTLATNFGPGDENSPTDMARFLAHLKIYIQAVFSCSILVVHHTGKDVSKGSRGGSSIEANADCVYTLERQKGQGDLQVTLHCKHIKDSERPPDIFLKAKSVELGCYDRKGVPVTSLVLDMELNDFEQTVLAMTKNGKSQRYIAGATGKSKTSILKAQNSLQAKKLLTGGCK